MKTLLDYVSTVTDIRQEKKVLHKMMEGWWLLLAITKILTINDSGVKFSGKHLGQTEALRQEGRKRQGTGQQGTVDCREMTGCRRDL